MKAQNSKSNLLLLLLFFSHFLVAQSLGVKTSSPNTSLDVNGGVSFREGTALSLSNGVNSNIALADYTLYRVTGPTTAFSITGFANGANGRVLILINATSYTMTFTHQATSISANQINTGGADFAIATNGVVTLIYNATLTKWVVSGGQGLVNSWSTVGNRGTTAGTHFIGTTDNQELQLKINSISTLSLNNSGMGGYTYYFSNGNAGYPSYIGVFLPWFSPSVDTSAGITGSIGDNDFYAIYGNVPTSVVGTDGELHFITGDDGDEPIIFEQYALTGSVYTERLRMDSNGYIGVNTSSPNVNLDVDGGLATRPATTVSLTADNQAVTVGNESFLSLSSNNATATNRTFTLSSGLQSGQVLVIILTSNAAELADSGNCNLASTYAMGVGDMITLMWNGSTWYERSRSNN